jgi:hypothetical protein
MSTVRYVNDFGNGHSGFVDYGSGFVVTTSSGQPLNVATASGDAVQVQAATVAGDAFVRLRTSTPLTLFDSSHRYADNGKWSTATGVNSTATFSSGEGLMNLTVDTTSGAFVTRETKTVSSYQPGKSLQVLNTFVMAPADENLRQRSGYFGADNGIYFEVSGNAEPCFVERSSVGGSLSETRVYQSEWQYDKLDGTGRSGFVLDPAKAQIFWTDIEWLGLGTVRTGFVINGQLVHCHSFDHANLITSTYITTASLPLRTEIENLGTTSASSTLKQVCSTVISEGGYELRGSQVNIGTPIGSIYDLAVVSTNYPVVSIRLKSTRLDAIVIMSALSVLGITNNSRYKWQVVMGGTTTGGTWTSVGADSAVEYNLTGTSFTGGRVVAGGYTAGSNQGVSTIDIPKEELFKFQLERNGLTNTPFELTLTVATDNAGADVFASLDFEEIGR